MRAVILLLLAVFCFTPVTSAANKPRKPSSTNFKAANKMIDQMRDNNAEMLATQVAVGETSRDYQARSNILNTKSDTEQNAVRNIRS